MACKHEHGAFILDTWVCGQCFRKLPDRPTSYRPEEAAEVWPEGRPARQVAVRCPIRKTESGTTLLMFVTWMAARLIVRTADPVTHEDAVDLCLDMLTTLGEEFGNDAVDWDDREGAYEIVDEELQNFDALEGASN